MSDAPKNEHAAALARLGRGVPKTMSAAAIAQRKKAAKQPRKKKQNDTTRETN